MFIQPETIRFMQIEFIEGYAWLPVTAENGMVWLGWYKLMREWHGKVDGWKNIHIHEIPHKGYDADLKWPPGSRERLRTFVENANFSSAGDLLAPREDW